MKKVYAKYSGFVFGEGKKDKVLLMALISHRTFEYHTKNWRFNYGNGHGCSAKDILKKCRKDTTNRDYDLVLCFIDLDDLKNDYPHGWERKKAELESEYVDFKIIWHEDCAEDEYRRAIGSKFEGKNKINRTAKEQVERFVNSDYWHRILVYIREREEELEGIRE